MAKSFLISLFGGEGFLLSILFLEASGVPVLHGDHGMVGRGESFFFADGGDPCVDCVFVGLPQAIVIRVIHAVAW